MVDFREFYDEKPHWYQELIQEYKKKAVIVNEDFGEEYDDVIYEYKKDLNRIQYDPDESFLDMEFLNLPISREQEVFEDPGKSTGDKHKTIRELCQRITKLMKEEQHVLLICMDGQSVCKYIATLCKWMYDGDYSKRVDVSEIKSQKQKEQIAVIEKGIMEFNNGIRKFFFKTPRNEEF